ncbi:potassium channel family protein [Halonatronum saccharophilum]|uniref:potassium channel family protein n=1 Tax=Halonatronum saccharophilum TaxID=150060 RepID=UPI0004856079|nr:TrkA family potassium uptake protein [Halonatronum saccharophilum]
MSKEAKQYIVLGLGRFGSSVARTLSSKGYDVLAIDTDDCRVLDISSEVTHAVEADATDEEALKALGVNNFDVAVVSIGQNIHASILATLVLKELGVKYVVAKAQHAMHGKVLSKVGADRIVYPERDMGVRVANNLISTNLLDYIELSPDYRIIELVADKRYAGQTLRKLDLRRKYGVNVIAIKANDKVILSPEADHSINEGDLLVVVGHADGLKELRD